MSLSDTVFIFVLALIIFGPKKLPEIGRQIGRLVGEFRRASNEFKFQIEEELRQADMPKISNTITRPAIASSAEDADLSISSADGTIHPASDFTLSEAMPAGQHPNPDAMQEVVDSSAIHEPERDWSSHEIFGEPKMPVSLATITAAVGAEARKTEPYVPVAEAASPTADEAIPPRGYQPQTHNGSPADAPSSSPYPASPEAEIHHG